MGQVISLQQYKDNKFLQVRLEAYRKVITDMDKQDLLEEILRFREKRKKEGSLFLKKEENLMRGIILFSTAQQRAETDELRDFALNYVSHLKECYREIKKSELA